MHNALHTSTCQLDDGRRIIVVSLGEVDTILDSTVVTFEVLEPKDVAPDGVRPIALVQLASVHTVTHKPVELSRAQLVDAVEAAVAEFFIDEEHRGREGNDDAEA